MIPSEVGGAETFGDRLRTSRQRLRTASGRRWTQGDLAAAVGVERNTVSRWENGGVLPKDPAVLASLSRVLRVSADWLLGGLSSIATGAGAGPGADRTGMHEPRDGRYRQAGTTGSALPRSAAELTRGYIDRMAGAGCSAEQIAGAEALLTAGALNSVASRAFDERSDTEIAADVDAAWDLIVHILRREGIRP